MFTDYYSTGNFNDNNDTQEPTSVTETPARSDGRAKIKVIGVGGAGNNAVNCMIDAGITSAEYIAVNTDAQSLACSKASVRVQIGKKLTKGLGAGADPEQGKNAAEEDKEELIRAIEDTDLLFIAAGMGGGTGTGAAPVIAKLARDRRILTVAVVTQPFTFEGKYRMDNARKGIEEIKKYVDTIVMIPNDKILETVPKNTTVREALRVADDVLKQGIRGIADIIVTPAIINLDFADVKTILKDKGYAHMGVGVAKGENRIVKAVRLAVNSPLLETTIEGATAVLINITGGDDLTMDETQTAAGLVQSVVDYSANIIFGTCIDENMQDEVQVTIIATGFQSRTPRQASNEAYREEIPAEPAFRPREALRQKIAEQTSEEIAEEIVPPTRPMKTVEEAPPVAPAPSATSMPVAKESGSSETPASDTGSPATPEFLKFLLKKKYQ